MTIKELLGRIKNGERFRLADVKKPAPSDPEEIAFLLKEIQQEIRNINRHIDTAMRLCEKEKP